MAPQAKLWGAGRSKQHRCKAISKSLDTSWEALQSGVVGCFLCSSWASQRSLSPLQFALCITTAPCTCIGQIKPHGSELGSACEYPMRGSIPWAVAASSPAVWRLRQLCHLRPRQYRHTDSTSLCHACEQLWIPLPWHKAETISVPRTPGAFWGARKALPLLRLPLAPVQRDHNCADTAGMHVTTV